VLGKVNIASASRMPPKSFWWACRDSNPGPTGYEPAALTAELQAPPLRSIGHARFSHCPNFETTNKAGTVPASLIA
jgi:hypothetical protein